MVGAVGAEAPVLTNMQTSFDDELLSSHGISVGLVHAAHDDAERAAPRQGSECCCLLTCAFAPCLMAFGVLRVCCGAWPKHPAWRKKVGCVSAHLRPCLSKVSHA
jgi:hypothetical protein